MTESEWLACCEPSLMLRFIGNTAHERQLRLFACACCRRIWHQVPPGDSRQGIEALERFQEDQISKEEFTAAANACWDAVPDVPSVPLAEHTIGEWQAGWAASDACTSHASKTWEWVDRAAWRAAAAAATDGLTWADPAWESQLRSAMPPHGPSTRPPSLNSEIAQWTALELNQADFSRFSGWAQERAAQAALLRDILGNPFRPVKPASDWLKWNNGTIPALVRSIYEARAFDQLPLLADALEDAGCTNPVILDHCREPAEHAPGCWLLDALLSWHQVLISGGTWS
jgi:hypothetical protein